MPNVCWDTPFFNLLFAADSWFKFKKRIQKSSIPTNIWLFLFWQSFSGWANLKQTKAELWAYERNQTISLKVSLHKILLTFPKFPVMPMLVELSWSQLNDIELMEIWWPKIFQSSTLPPTPFLLDIDLGDNHT